MFKMESTQRCPLVFYFIFTSFLLPGAFSDKELRRGVYNGDTIKVLAYNFPPMFTWKPEKGGNHTFGGMAKTLMDDAKDYLNISLKFSVIETAEVNQLGIIEALRRRLDKKEIDIVPFLFDQDLINLKRMELTTAIWISPLVILQPWPKEESRLKVLIRPFELPVWICYFSITILFLLSTSALIRFQEKHRKETINTKSISEIIYVQLEYILTITFNQGNTISYKAVASLKLVVGIWLLCMVVLINAYSGVLTSLLAVPKLEPIVKTLQEVAEKEMSGLRVTLEKDSGITRDLLAATKGYQKILGDQLRQDPTLFCPTNFDAIENIVRRKCVYPGPVDSANYIIHEDTKAFGHCRMTSSRVGQFKDFGHVAYQIGAPIGSPYVPAFNEFILRLQASGIIALYKLRHLPTTNQCRTDVPPQIKVKPLTLTDFTAAFFILGIGLSISILAFWIQILSKYLKLFSRPYWMTGLMRDK